MGGLTVFCLLEARIIPLRSHCFSLSSIFYGMNTSGRWSWWVVLNSNLEDLSRDKDYFFKQKTHSWSGLYLFSTGEFRVLCHDVFFSSGLRQAYEVGFIAIWWMGNLRAGPPRTPQLLCGQGNQNCPALSSRACSTSLQQLWKAVFDFNFSYFNVYTVSPSFSWVFYAHSQHLRQED